MVHEHDGTNVTPAILALALAVSLSGAGLMYKYLGASGLFACLALVMATVVFSVRGYPWVRVRLTERQATWLSLGLMVALAAAFLVVFPLADGGTLGPGSDADDALDVAVRELLNGRYPYYPRTYLDNLISPMPGAVLLAVPFVLLKTSALQNLFWLAAFMWWLRSRLGDAREVLFLTLLLLLSPAVVHQVLVGGDLISNAIYVLLGCLLVIEQVRGRGVGWQTFAAAALLGVALSSRAHFVFVVPLLIALLARLSSWREAIWVGGAIVGSFGLVTFPFLLYDPSGFSPFHTAGKLGQYDQVLPYFSWAVLVAMAGCTAYLARRVTTVRGFLLSSAFVLVIPIGAAVVFRTVLLGGRGLLISSYAVSFLPFLVLGACVRNGSAKVRPS